MRMACFSVGLDLGQARDFSALAVVERVRVLPAGVSRGAWSDAVDAAEHARAVGDRHRAWMLEQRIPVLTEEARVRHLARWQIGTPYPVVVDDVVELMASEALARDGVLFIDGTGVGVAVRDLFTDAHRSGRLRGAYPPVAVTITSGEHASGWNASKVDLIGAVQAPLQAGTLKVAAGLALGEVLERELTNFRLKLTASGRSTFEVARREGEGHGDLVMALGLALVHGNTARRPDVVEAPVAA